jgi:major membrane immunogen (membrane-anchored lipoprotein)
LLYSKLFFDIFRQILVYFTGKDIVPNSNFIIFWLEIYLNKNIQGGRKKMNKQLSIVLCVILTVCLLLTGCGGGGGTGGGTGGGGGGTPTGNGIFQGYMYYDPTTNIAVCQSSNKAASDRFQPLAGATLVLSPNFGSGLTTISGNDGAFSFVSLADGNYYLSAVLKDNVEYKFSDLSVTIQGGKATMGSGVYSSIAFDIPNGSSASLYAVMNKSAYLLYAVQNKTEGDVNSAEIPTVPVTLSLINTTTTSSSMSSGSSSKAALNTPYAPIPNKSTSLLTRNYTNTKMQNAKKQYLSGGARRTVSAPKAAAPTVIVEGTTPWNGVWVWDSNSSADVQINTTCQKVTSTAYIFVDNNSTISSSQLNAFASKWDSICQTNRTKFGNEKDYDGNGKVIIIFSDKVDYDQCYYSPYDRMSEAEANQFYAHSNEGDIIYVTTDPSVVNTDDLYRNLIVWFSDMIYFDSLANHGVTTFYVWLYKGLMGQALYYNGYGNYLNTYIASYLSAPTTSLTYPTETTNSDGMSVLFVRYIYEQFGDTAIKNLVQNGQVGITAVQTATGKDFNELYKDWAWALVLTDTGVTYTSNAKYNFRTVDIGNLASGARKGLQPSGTLSPTMSNVNFSWQPYRLVFTRLGSIQANTQLSISGATATAFGLQG